MPQSKPLNKDYQDLELHDSRGKLLVKPDTIKKKARFKRERGRFRINGHLQKRYYKYTPDEDPEGGTSLFEYENRYYEDAEITKDSIRNTFYEPEKVPKGRIIDDGGDFDHTDIYISNVVTKLVHNVNDTGDGTVEEVGQVWLILPVQDHLDLEDIGTAIIAPEEDYDLSEVGPRLWGFLNPLKSNVDLGVNIAEMRDLPRLVKGKLDSLKSLVSSLSNPKGLADWFLAIQFGWNPLLADIRKCIKAYFRLEARIDFLMRNGGEPLHRKTPPWAPQSTSEILIDESGPENPGWMHDVLPTDADPDEMENRFKWKLELRKTVTEKASGVFTYHLGNIPPTPAYLRLKLVGLLADEDLLWEATRWSWLVDWFSNIGQVLSNIKATYRDRVVALYAYAQRRVVREYIFTCTNGFYTVSVTRVFDTKSRRKIDPFGLAPGDGLTDIQLGILVALGLTRA